MIARLYYVRCDGCGVPAATASELAANADGARCDGCGRACGVGADLANTAVGARKLAKRRGWARTPKRNARHEGGSDPGADLCPLCRAVLAREVEE